MDTSARDQGYRARQSCIAGAGSGNAQRESVAWTFAQSRAQHGSARQRIHRRIRKKVAGTAQRPRLAVHFSGKHIYAQVIDDDAGRTIAAASTAESRMRSGLLGKAKAHANQAAAELVGKAIAERSLAKNLDRVVFDRGGFFYHGKVKALADAARAGGLKF